LIGLLLHCQKGHSQDIHFSQFFASPLFTNPALAGQFEGTYRFTGIIRRQWASVSAQPYQTFGGGIDINKPLNLKPVGIGLRIGQDYAGLSNYSNTSIDVPISFRIRFGAKKSWLLAFAGQIGFFQLNYDMGRVSYGDQYNGVRYDPSTPSQDQYAGSNPSVLRLNLGSGVYLENRISERKRIGLGFSSFNLTQPNISLVKSSSSELARRSNIHAFSSFPIGSSPMDLMPAFQYQFQGIHRELLFGSAIRYHLSTEANNVKSVQAGLWGRAKDAGYLSVGLQQNSLYLGASYDFNLSGLKVASAYRGGWEFSIIYIISTVREKTIRVLQCPDYL